MMAELVLKRRVRGWASRPVAFVNLTTGEVAHESGEGVRSRVALDLGRLLFATIHPRWGDAKPETLYIVGGWDAASVPPDEWFDCPADWERVEYHRDPFLAIYKHATGRKVHLYMTAPWFGRCSSVAVVRLAFLRLRQILRTKFDSGVSIMGTPARTGLDLIERSLPDGCEYPLIPAILRETILHNAGQGRMQWIAQPGALAGVEALYTIDANWMYMSCLHTLPASIPQHDYVSELADGGYRPGFYHIRFQVPEGWAHIGLLPTWQGRATWPDRYDGQWHEAFVSGEELRLAMVENGWICKIQERWLFARENEKGARPLRTWSEKLKQAREECTQEREGDLAKPLRDALRALCIMAIGSLYRRGRYALVETPISQADTLPAEALQNLDENAYGDGSVIRWWKQVPLDPATAHYHHPEWSALIWFRARARLARAALNIPYSDIVALRTDEIVTTCFFSWQDDGKPGTFRVKEQPLFLAGRVPENEQQYQKIRKGVQ